MRKKKRKRSKAPWKQGYRGNEAIILMHEEESTPTQETLTADCWFCGATNTTICECRRPYCAGHGFGGRCLVCALGLGLFEQAYEPETVSGIIMASLSAASGDPYI